MRRSNRTCEHHGGDRSGGKVKSAVVGVLFHVRELVGPGFVTLRRTFVHSCQPRRPPTFKPPSSKKWIDATVNPTGSWSDQRAIAATYWSRPGPTTLCPGWPLVCVRVPRSTE